MSLYVKGNEERNVDFVFKFFIFTIISCRTILSTHICYVTLKKSLLKNQRKTAMPLPPVFL